MRNPLTQNGLPGISLPVQSAALAAGYLPLSHPQLGDTSYRVRQMPNDPDSQVGQTLSVMREKVAEDVKDPGFRGRAYALFGGLDPYSTVEAVWLHTKQSIRFQRDEVTGEGIGGYPQEEVVEVIIRPVEMARFIDRGDAFGDCDDFSSYIAACLGVLGIPCMFKTVAADSRDPGQFSHVYVMAYPQPGIPVAVDASHGPYCGWEVGGFGREAEWATGNNGDCGLLSGCITSVVAVVGGWWLFNKWKAGELSWT